MADIRAQLQVTKDKEQRSKLIDRLNGLARSYASLLRLYNEIEATRVEYEKMITNLITDKHHYIIQYRRLEKGTDEPIITNLLQQADFALEDVKFDDSSLNPEAVANES